MSTSPARRAAAAAISAGLLSACASLGGGSADSNGAPPATSDGGEVVARVDGREVTLAELDQHIRDELFAQETRDSAPAQLYKTRSEYLDAWLAEIVLEAEAERLGIPADEVVAEQIEVLGPVSSEEARAFYDENKGRIRTPGDYETLEPQIITFLEQDRANKAREMLLAKADVEVLLDRPRFEVEPIGASRGPEDATVTIVEFSDFECPFCRRAQISVEDVVDRYPDDVRLVYRHLPLAIHENARAAAIASICADEQGRFWEYHDMLFDNQQALQPDDLRRYAEMVGMDPTVYDACIVRPDVDERVQADIDAARALRISGTPAFYVNGVLLNGARPSSDFEEIIERELSR